jgi:hypothetical protein
MFLDYFALGLLFFVVGGNDAGQAKTKLESGVAQETGKTQGAV